MKPRAFYIGFPPAIVKIERNGVEYGIGAIPLGGYVRIPGMHRPAGSDFQTLMSAAVGEDPALRQAVNTVQPDLDADAFEAADAALARSPPNRASAGERSGASLRRAGGPRRRRGLRARRVLAAADVEAGRVVAAGPLTNVLIAFVLFFAVYATGASSTRRAPKLRRSRRTRLPPRRASRRGSHRRRQSPSHADVRPRVDRDRREPRPADHRHDDMPTVKHAPAARLRPPRRCELFCRRSAPPRRFGARPRSERR
ncbi:MAG: site-2 protease family protein [Actinomycetota bacterium]|nr:site-2 protease family protein [Actinomycetota bacterium]